MVDKEVNFVDVFACLPTHSYKNWNTLFKQTSNQLSKLILATANNNDLNRFEAIIKYCSDALEEYIRLLFEEVGDYRLRLRNQTIDSKSFNRGVGTEIFNRILVIIEGLYRNKIEYTIQSVHAFRPMLKVYDQLMVHPSMPFLFVDDDGGFKTTTLEAEGEENDNCPSIFTKVSPETIWNNWENARNIVDPVSRYKIMFHTYQGYKGLHIDSRFALFLMLDYMRIQSNIQMNLPPEISTDSYMDRFLILLGPPGSGKSNLLITIARFLDIPMLELNNDGFITQYAGQGEQNVRLMFQYLENFDRHRGVIVVLNDADSIFSPRSSNASEFENRIKSTMLSTFDRLTRSNNKKTIMYFCMTSNIDLDPALVRRGNVIYMEINNNILINLLFQIASIYKVNIISEDNKKVSQSDEEWKKLQTMLSNSSDPIQPTFLNSLFSYINLYATYKLLSLSNDNSLVTVTNTDLISMKDDNTLIEKLIIVDTFTIQESENFNNPDIDFSKFAIGVYYNQIESLIQERKDQMNF